VISGFIVFLEGTAVVAPLLGAAILGVPVFALFFIVVVKALRSSLSIAIILLIN
jgi:hypothetical protein